MSTTALDLALGQGDDDSRPQVPAIPDGAPEPQQDAAPARLNTADPDVREAEAARAAVEAERAAAAGNSQDATQQDTPKPQPSAAGNKPATGKAKVVPYDRFADVNRQLAQAKERVAYLEGALAARGPAPDTAPAQGTAPPAQPTQQQPTTAGQPDEIQQLQAQLVDSADRFDRGEITLREHEQTRAQIENRIADLRLAQVRATQPASSLMDEAYEAAHLRDLYAKHPYAANLTGQQAEILRVMAEGNLAAKGEPIRDASKRETLRLRAEVARLSDTFGPEWGVEATVQPSSQQQPNGTRQQQPTTRPAAPALSPTAQARQAKMAMADRLPPDPATIGQGAAPDVSDEQIANMSDEQIGALPPHVRKRLLAIA